jgi:hypothetical protein
LVPDGVAEDVEAHMTKLVENAETVDLLVAASRTKDIIQLSKHGKSDVGSSTHSSKRGKND